MCDRCIFSNMPQGKESKLLHIQNLLSEVARFLKLYLPIANAHMTDFIVKDWWMKLIPQSIRDDLLALSETDLMLLPSGRLYSSEKCSECHEINSSNQSERCLSGEVPLRDESATPVWKHETLKDFILACQHNQLRNMNMLTDLSELLENDDDMMVREFMCLKKQHEVNLMGKICGSIAKQNNINVVVDIGSGKGYLSSQLTLQHGLRVLGIDASSSNTEGATDRAQRLGRQWHGLVARMRRNQTRSVDESCSLRTQLTDHSSGLNSFGGNMVSASVTPDSTADSIDTSESGSQSVERCERGEFVAVTQYVDRYTDVQCLLRRHLNKTSSGREFGVRGVNGSFIMDTESEAGEVATSTTAADQEVPTSLAKESASDDETLLHYMITGLHACGDLTPDMLRLFVEQPGASILCNVGCCYHHLTEAFIRSPHAEDDLNCDRNGFPLSEFLRQHGCRLGRNARMLASQAPDRIADNGKAPDRSLYWRALLQVILHDMTGELRDDWRVGKIARKCKDFNEYVEKALRKLGSENKLTATDIANYEQNYGSYQRYVQCFVQLKAALASCIEALLLLDRACFLLEQDNICDVHVVQAFSPVISPRCYAIIALKSSSRQ